MHIEKAHTSMNLDPDSEEVESEDYYNIKEIGETQLKKILEEVSHSSRFEDEDIEEIRKKIEEALKDPEEKLKDSMEDDRSIEEQLEDMQGENSED